MGKETLGEETQQGAKLLSSLLDHLQEVVQGQAVRSVGWAESHTAGVLVGSVGLGADTEGGKTETQTKTAIGRSPPALPALILAFQPPD